MKFLKFLTLIVILLVISIDAKLSRKIKSEASASTTAVAEKSKDKNKFVGMKVGLTEETVNKFFQFYFPKVFELLKKAKIPDFKIPTQSLALSEFNLNLDNIKSENMKITYKKPNKIVFVADKLLMKLSLKVQREGTFSALTYDYADVDIKNLSIGGDIVVDMQPHPTNKKTFIPSFSIDKDNFKLSFDFDFKLRGMVFNKLLSIWYDSLKETIEKAILGWFDKTGVTFLQKYLDSIHNYLSGEYFIKEKLFVNYSLMDKPVISEDNKNLIFNFDGITNLQGYKWQQESNDFPKGSKPLEKLVASQDASIMISEYSINAAVKSLYRNLDLIFKVDIPDLYAYLPKEENLSFFAKIIKFFAFNDVNYGDIKKKFDQILKGGKEGLLTIALQNNEPEITLDGSDINVKVSVLLAISGKVGEEKDKLTDFLAVQLDLRAKFNLIYEGGLVKLKIIEYFVDKYQNINSISKLFKKDKVMAWLSNKGLDMYKNQINSKVESVPFKPKPIGSFTFDNVVMKIENSVLLIHSNVVIGNTDTAVVTTPTKTTTKKKFFKK